MASVERWAPVGFPGYAHYRVSTTGKIVNKYGKILKPYSKNNEYQCIDLWQKNKKKAFRVNRVVASAFLDDWNPALTVDHINHVPSDNRAENLRMFTQQQQVVHRRPFKKRSWLRLEQRTMDGTLLDTFTTLSDAAKAVGASTTDRIVACALGKVPSAHGYAWTTPTHFDWIGEEWKHVTPTVQVSNMGRVLRTHRNTGLMCIAVEPKDCYQMDGYPQVHFDHKRAGLHVMVAKLFLAPPDDPAKTMVNHKDGDLLNARADNLEWVTPSQNTQHAHDTGLLNTKRTVNQYDMNGEFVATYGSLKEAALAVGCHRRNISANVCGFSKSASGFVWKCA